MANGLVYVGTYSEPLVSGTGELVPAKGKGIYAFRLDSAKGALVPVGVTEGTRNASFLAFDPRHKFLYCVNELEEYEGQASGGVSAYRIDAATGTLTYLNTQASHGTDPCHLVVDGTGRNVIVANYSSGSIAVLPIDTDGSVREASCVIQHNVSSVNPSRQAGPHAHCIAIDAANRYVLVCELGGDCVMTYTLDAEKGMLTPNPNQPSVKVAPGSGPRHLAFHPNGRFAYVISELNSTMTAFAFDAAKGTLAELQTLSTLPAGFSGQSSGAELQVAPSGRFLYGSNRGHDSIVIYAIDPNTGRMTMLGHEGTQGKNPRYFTFSPDGTMIAAANQNSDNVVMFRVRWRYRQADANRQRRRGGSAHLRQIPLSRQREVAGRARFV